MTERVQTFAEQAIERMLKEMNEGHDELTDQIHNWLCEKPQVEDEELMGGVVKDKKKTLASCCAYVRNQAKREAHNGFAAVRDDVVYGWVRDFFTKDNIQAEKPEFRVASKTERIEEGPKKTKEQLEEERKEYEQEQLKRKEIAKAEKQAEKEKKKAKENGFIDIFEFMDDPFEDFPKIEQTHEDEGEVEDDEENCDDD